MRRIYPPFLYKSFGNTNFCFINVLLFERFVDFNKTLISHTHKTVFQSHGLKNAMESVTGRCKTAKKDVIYKQLKELLQGFITLQNTFWLRKGFVSPLFKS